MNIIQKPAHTNNYTRQNTKKVGFVLHWIVGELESADITFANPNRQASAHYGIGSNGEVHQYVADEFIAWHAGNWDANTKYIGIEHAGGQDLGGGNRKKPTEQCHLTSIELITNLCRKHGISRLTRGQNIFRHNEISATQCCGSLEIDRITNAVNNNLNNNNQSANNNMSNMEQQKNIARGFLENPVNQGMPFNDGNTYGYLRSIIDLPVEQGGQNPAEALKRFGDQAIASYNTKVNELNTANAEIASLQTQIQSLNAAIKEKEGVVGGYTESLRVASLNNERLKQENEELQLKLAKCGVENTELKKQNEKLPISEKFSIDKFIVGIVSGKNQLANVSLITFLSGLSAYLSSLIQVATPEIASILTAVTGGLGMVLIYFKNKQPKETVKENKKIQL